MTADVDWAQVTLAGLVCVWPCVDQEPCSSLGLSEAPYLVQICAVCLQPPPGMNKLASACPSHRDTKVQVGKKTHGWPLEAETQNWKTVTST